MTELRFSPRKSSPKRIASNDSSDATMYPSRRNNRSPNAVYSNSKTLLHVLALSAVWTSGFFMAKNIGHDAYFNTSGPSRKLSEEKGVLASQSASVVASSLRRSGCHDTNNDHSRAEIITNQYAATPAYQPGVPMNVQQPQTSLHPKWKLWTEMTPAQQQMALQETNQYLKKYGKLITSKFGSQAKQTIKHGSCELTSVGLKGNHQLCGPALNGNCT